MGESDDLYDVADLQSVLDTMYGPQAPPRAPDHRDDFDDDFDLSWAFGHRG
jgi:hypothetical protein